MTNGHAAAETVAMTTKKPDEQKLLAEKAAQFEMIRRQMEEERERRRALIAEVQFVYHKTFLCDFDYGTKVFTSCLGCRCRAVASDRSRFFVTNHSI